MNPFLVALIAMLFRYGLVLLAGALGLSGPVQELVSQYATEFTQLSIAVAIAILTIGYAGFRKFRDRQKLVTALASPVPMSEAAAKAMVTDPSTMTPSVTTPKHEVPR